MYRKYSKQKIAEMITIYSNGNTPRELVGQIMRIQPFFENPTKSELIKLITDKSLNSDCKIALLSTINCAINWTSIKPFVNNPAMVTSMFHNVNIKPIYTFEQAKAIALYIITKGGNTSLYSNNQVTDVENFLKDEGYEYILSKSGATDIHYNFTDAGADGKFTFNQQDIYLYLRYGSSSGGSQNDRFRETFKTAKLNPDKKFVFVVDGPEAILEYNIAEKCILHDEYPNAIWTTVKMLPLIDFENMSFNI